MRNKTEEELHIARRENAVGHGTAQAQEMLAEAQEDREEQRFQEGVEGPVVLLS